MDLEGLHGEIDRVIKRLEQVKQYRGGTLQFQLGDMGARLLDMAAAVRADYDTFS